MSLSQDVLEELELLRSMYENAELTITENVKLPFTAFLRARPYVAFNDAHVFCCLNADIKMNLSYPSTPATVDISCSRGLDDAQIKVLRKELADSAENESKENAVHLWLLVKLIRDRVTEANKPNQCPVCCHPIDIDGVENYGCIRLEPCWHAIHAGCFRDYLTHQRFERDEKEKRLKTSLGSIGAREKAWERWMCCPICRIPVDLNAAKELVSGFIHL